MAYKSLLWVCIVALCGVSSAMPPESSEVLEAYRNTCISKSGTDQGYQQVIRSIHPSKVCFLNTVNYQQLSIDMMVAPDDSWKAVFLSYCPRFNKSISCFENILDGVTKCIGKDEEQYKTVFRNTFYNLVNLICEKESRFFTKVVEPQFKSCLDQLQQFAVECGVSNITNTGSLNSFTEENCQGFEQSRECFKTKVDDCGAPFWLEIFDAFYKAIIQGSSCNQFLKVSETINNDINETNS